VRAILVTCPHCGARLQVESGDVITCEYCGTSSRVQRRTMMFDRVKPPPVQGPAPIAVQYISPTARRAAWSLAVIPLAIAGFSFWQTQRAMSRSQRISQQATERARSQASSSQASSSSSSSSSQKTTQEAGSWWSAGRAPILVDVDGNGTLDVVGRTRRVHAGDSVRLIALDGTTGTPLWESEPIGTYGDTYTGTLAVAGELLVFASPRAVVHAFELSTGTSRWTTSLDERIVSLCEGDEETLIAIGKDNVARSIRRADGSWSPTEAPAPAPAAAKRAAKRGNAPPCTKLPSDEAMRTWELRDDALGRRHEVHSAKLFEGPGGRVLAGQRARGTRAATLVAVDAKGEARWKVLVAQDPLAASENEPRRVVVGDDTVCASYYGGSITDPERVACFSLADGARHWDLSATTKTVETLQVLGTWLVISATGLLEVRALSTGEQVWAFGP
jgi:outer membrane protein assembly factor BamB/DNA-directed RNA polymerase subunit RPC12/RpoP